MQSPCLLSPGSYSPFRLAGPCRRLSPAPSAVPVCCESPGGRRGRAARLLHLELTVHPGGTGVGMELPAAALRLGELSPVPPITWVTLGGQSWHGAALATLGRGQAQRQLESTERWRRVRRQSICDVHRFLMRPVACLALSGSIRRRCLEKLTTAHCSKTLDYLTAMARARGTGRAGTGPGIPCSQRSSSPQPPLPRVTHPRDGRRWGKKSMSWPCAWALPTGPRYPRGCCPLCKGQDILGSSHPNPPHSGPPASSLPGCKCGCRKQRLTAPTQQPWKKAAKGQFSGWGGTAASPKASQATATLQAGLAQLFREPSGAAQWLWLLSREARESKTSPSS